MKFFRKMADGGVESTVTGYWLCEIKSLFSVVLLRFEGKSREAYHEHAFNCINWVIKGWLQEWTYEPSPRIPGANERFKRFWRPSIVPFLVRRSDFHKVDSCEPVSWILSIRGPWAKTWKEYLPLENRERTLTFGRVEL